MTLYIANIIVIYKEVHFIFLDVPTDCNSQHVSYEEIEMKQIVHLPSELIENNCTNH